MKKLFIAMACALAMAACTDKKAPVRVACVGDSITEGFALANPSVESYPSVLASLLGDGYEVVNCGCSARTLSKTGDLPYVNEAIYQTALDTLPDIVTIMLGTNDTKPWNWHGSDNFAQDLNALIDRFLALPSSPRIILALPIPAERESWGINDSINTLYIAPIYRQIAQKKGLQLIETYAAMLPYYPELYTDSVHPNADGAKVLAAQFDSAIKSYN